MLVLLFLRAGAGVCGGGGVGGYIIITGAFFFSGGPLRIGCPWASMSCRPSCCSLHGGEVEKGGGDAYFSVDPARRFVFLFSPASSLSGRGSPAVLQASEPAFLAKLWPSAIKPCWSVHRFTGTPCVVLTHGASKKEASSLRWVPASSCNIGVGLDVGGGSELRRRRQPGVLYKDQDVIFIFFIGVFVRMFM